MKKMLLSLVMMSLLCLGATGIAEQQPVPYFLQVRGTVDEISDFVGIEGAKFISITDETSGTINIVVNEKTYSVDNAEFNVGDQITAFYPADAPAIMIFPPQYTASVVLKYDPEKILKVDLFDSQLVSRDNMLKLNISDRTEILLEDGTPFDGALENRKLVVFYSVSTRSIPAQTTPEKIIVLRQEQIPEIPEIPEIAPPGDPVFDGDTIIIDDGISVSGEIVVSGNVIDAPEAFTNDAGVCMVPLRAVAEALDFEVGWNGDDKSVTLDDIVKLRIGDHYYQRDQADSIQLETAPLLLNGVTHVPLDFFRKVVGVVNAYVLEGQVVIDNNEIME